MNLLRYYIKELLNEQPSSPPVLDDLGVTVRVSINSPVKPTMDHILTKIRGLPDVITVRQAGRKRPAPEGKNLVNLMIRFERGDGYTIEDLKKDLLTVPGVDLSAIKLINDEPYVKEALRNCVRALLNEAVSSKVPIRLTPHSVQKYFDAYDKIGPSTMIAEFVSSVPLYRIVDAREILKIAQGGTIRGGKYNVGIERMGGAAYTLDPDELPAWGAAQTSRPAATSGMDKPGTGRMVGETLFIIEVDGGGEEFLAMGATLDGDKITPENPFDRDSKLGQAFDEWRGNKPTGWRRDYTPTPEQQSEERKKTQKAGDVIQDAVDYYNGLNLQLDARACTTGLGCNLQLTKEDIKKVWWFSGFDTPQEFTKAKEEITFAEAVELAKQEKTAMGKKPEETQTSSERAWTREGLVREYIRSTLLEAWHS